MSEVRVNNIVDYGGKGAPTFDNGAVISGVSSLGNQAKIGSNVTITSGGINVSGVTTAATLSGNLTGDINSGFVTATSAVIGSGVTINAGGLNITGVMTATTFEGSGTSLTGVALTIAPLAYNPDVSDSTVPDSTGIGITFDHRILAGSGNVTLSVATNAGAAGTTVENFGVGSSVTIQGRKAIIDPTSDLDAGETYHISYPSGAFTNTGGDVSYVGTAYTFGVKPYVGYVWAMGGNAYGQLGQNQAEAQLNSASSPIQIPGATWSRVAGSMSGYGQEMMGLKTDGTLWMWGRGIYGAMAQNNVVSYSSPVQIPGTTWSKNFSCGTISSLAVKTDGTLWSWGYNGKGHLGQNNRTDYSSPVQIPGTNWSITANQSGMGGNNQNAGTCMKTDGSLWAWGANDYGVLGQNNRTLYSSPVQITGTWTGSYLSKFYQNFSVIKSDGTLWAWGTDSQGSLGLNSESHRSSPTQVGSDDTWRKVVSGNYGTLATKTDGTLWTWGGNGFGSSGQNSSNFKRSSPVQIPGSTWNDIAVSMWTRYASKTDGSLWGWGRGDGGSIFTPGLANANKSSPTQLQGSATDFTGSLSACYGRALFNLRTL